MKRIHFSILAIYMLTPITLFTSCVDKEFDFKKDIDLAIHVGGNNGFALPIGNTDSIKLSDIIKKDSKSISCLNGGEYSLVKTNSLAPMSIKSMGAFNINVNPLYLPNLSLLSKNSGPVAEMSISSINVPLEFRQDNVSSEVLGVKSIDSPNASLTKVIMQFNVSGLMPGADIRAKDIKITFPSFIVADGLNSKNELIMTGDRLYSGMVKDFIIKNLDFSNENGGLLSIKNQLLEIKKNIKIEGNIDFAHLNPLMIIGDVRIGVSILVDPILVSQIEGQINPSIDFSISPMSFDVPDFLKNEEVTLDILDPVIRLNVKNNTDIPILLKGVLQAYRNNRLVNQVAVDGGVLNPIMIDANGQTIVSLSKTGTSGDASSKKYQIPNIDKLVEKIPDEVRFKVNATADQRVVHKIDLTKCYTVDVDYSMELPLKFGPGVSIVYTDTIDGFNNGVRTFDTQKVGVEMVAENNIPLVLSLEALPIGVDKSMGPLQGISVKVIGDIHSCNKSGAVQKSPLYVELTEIQPGAMKQLDGLMIKIVAKSNEAVYGMPLKENQFIRLKDIKAKAFGGVNIDCN